MSYLKISAGAIALAMFAGSVSAFEDAKEAKEAKETTHDGTVLKISSTELVMKGNDRKEHTHTLSSATKMTLDGRDCKAADLKSGVKIRVTTVAADRKAVSRIEAIRRNAMFANTHEGAVVSSTSSELVMTDSDGNEHSHTVTADTSITCDGKVCKAADLKSKMKIRVTTKKLNEGPVTVIEAIDKNADFA